MKTNNEISGELMDLSPLLAELEKTNPFTVPDGYFDSLADSVSLIAKNEIPAELDELSPLLAELDKTNPFTVPNGYFDNLAAIVTLVAKNDNSIVTGDPGQPPAEVPYGYFETLADNILHKIKAQEMTGDKDELKNLSPLLHSLQKENVFEVPRGYFDGLAGSIVTKLQPAQAKVISMHKPVSFIKYAVAAAMLGVLAFGIYTFSNKRSTIATTGTTVAATIPLDPAIEKGIHMNEAQFNEALDNLSSEEITSYLEKNSNETDLAILTSTIEENSLPSEDDYLLDEKTLENYLQDIDLQKLNN